MKVDSFYSLKDLATKRKTSDMEDSYIQEYCLLGCDAMQLL
jgi:uncharacterized protein YutD